MTDISIRLEAEENRQSIIKHRDEVQAGFLSLGSLLKECRDKSYWKKLDYDSFNSFLGDPEITFKYSTAANLIRIYEVYVEGMSIDGGTLAKIGSRRLQIILPVVKTDPDRWLAAAGGMSKSDLINEVREEQGRESVTFAADPAAPACSSYREYVKTSPCCVCEKRPSDPAHFPVSRGASAGDDDVILLCRECHSEQHQSGVQTFFNKYGALIFRWMYDTIHRGFK
jgi:hypothetical protein